MSASCSMAPDSRRSDSCGRFDAAAQLGRTVQLRKGDDRDVQLLGDGFERARDERHLLLAVASLGGLRAAGHQLQVVDHDDLDVVMYFQTARLRAELEDRQRRRVVDEEFGASQRLGGRFEVAPLFGREPSQFEIVARYARLGHHQTHHELVRRHFAREEGDRLLVVDRHVARHGECEGRLTHRGAGGDDDQIRRLPAHRHAVERHGSPTARR